MKKSIFLILATIFFWSCEDSDPFSDDSKSKIKNYGEFHRDTLFAIADTFLIQRTVNTGSSPKLLFGKYKDFETRFLVRFINFPADSFRIDSVKLWLRPVSTYGVATSSLTGRVYRITETWDEKVNADTEWDYQLKIDQSSETMSEIFTVNDTSGYTIALPETLVNIWRDTTAGDQNFGLLVDFESASYIQEIQSRDSGTAPGLIVSYFDTTNDTLITDTLYSYRDASLISYKGSFDSQRLYVVSGYPVHSFIKFDFSSIPENALISNVDFSFVNDSLISDINSNKTQALYLRDVTTDFDQLRIPYYEIDSTFTSNIYYNVILTQEQSSKLSLDIIDQPETAKYFIQSIINKDVKHGSFYLQYTNEGNDISVYGLYGKGDSPDAANDPFLVLEYFVKPETRL